MSNSTVDPLLTAWEEATQAAADVQRTVEQAHSENKQRLADANIAEYAARVAAQHAAFKLFPELCWFSGLSRSFDVGLLYRVEVTGNPAQWVGLYRDADEDEWVDYVVKLTLDVALSRDTKEKAIVASAQLVPGRLAAAEAELAGRISQHALELEILLSERDRLLRLQADFRSEGLLPYPAGDTGDGDADEGGDP